MIKTDKIYLKKYAATVGGGIKKMNIIKEDNETTDADTNINIIIEKRMKKKDMIII